MFRVHPVWGQCRWLHSSLRVSPAGAGGMGRVRVRERSGGANHRGALPPWGRRQGVGKVAAELRIGDTQAGAGSGTGIALELIMAVLTPA